MSLSDLAETPQSRDGTTIPGAISLTVPTNLIMLPAAAGLVGLSIGFIRGGSRARLRFLVENAHRKPKTVQGWYFYTKTRNYRVFFGALKAGGKYALGLGGATAGFVLVDESVGWAREQVFGPAGEIQDVAQSGPEGSAMKRKAGWRKGEVKWEDGGVAGGLMGLVVGTAYKLPRPLFIRSLIMGIALGSLTSGMQTVQARIGRMREEEERKAKLTDNQQLSSPTAAAAATSALVTEEVAPVMSLSEETKPTEEIIVDRIPGEEEPRSWWESVKSWVGA
ncbi:hypothetical protein J010_00101 [Cryptococcus neoformans]|uniref:Uncharacterized protein n=1 Tax=Cryptococcus neoformans Tu259-1 TaxID=1230072 RepID=A0A854QLU3_CRYNE|nr:hypothetical protein C353_00126 [Cryptococcus neoformans var. grubii AD1-83a]OWZ68919.1 hypothetical protein AYX15_00375 [Cryptococcus neoformans var. grubii]OXG30286.1 hypothetical protein C361_00119 [Cryptococcus neoformans var. grubii Tu259-1]OXG54769.1 hypothetical protein C355_00116 [Cryptococcus neoformans var. grubii Th84]OXG69362.1 hypothetical protein C351_00122 [Cryptococcus neoformans var. grubii c8]OXG70437.1 hypothetical protein C354_00129 [Cryptococcus neoformans var. grubii M